MARTRADGLVVSGQERQGPGIAGIDLERGLDSGEARVVLLLGGKERSLQMEGERQAGIGLERGLDLVKRLAVAAIGQEHSREARVGYGVLRVGLEHFGEILAGEAPGVLLQAQEASLDVGGDVALVGLLGLLVGAPGAVGVLVLHRSGRCGQGLRRLRLALGVEVEEVADMLRHGLSVAGDLGELDGQDAGPEMLGRRLERAAQPGASLVIPARDDEALGESRQDVTILRRLVRERGRLVGGLLVLTRLEEGLEAEQASAVGDVGLRLGQERLDRLEAAGVVALGDRRACAVQGWLRLLLLGGSGGGGARLRLLRDHLGRPCLTGKQRRLHRGREKTDCGSDCEQRAVAGAKHGVFLSGHLAGVDYPYSMRMA